VGIPAKVIQNLTFWIKVENDYTNYAITEALEAEVHFNCSEDVFTLNHTVPTMKYFETEFRD
jgi:hypothetical protein